MTSPTKKISAILIIAGCVAGAASFLILKQQELSKLPVAKRPGIVVELIQPQEGMVPVFTPYLADVDVSKSADISSKLTGYLEAVYVHEGDVVKQGDLLARIDDTELRNSIESLQSSKKASQKELELKQEIHNRNQKLYAIDALAGEQLDTSLVALTAAQAQVDHLDKQIESLQHQMHYAHLYAPYAGRIASVMAHKGDLAAPNKPLIKLNAADKKLTFVFSGNNIASGQEVYHAGDKIGQVTTVYDDAQHGLKVAEVALEQAIEYRAGENIFIDVRIKNVSGCVVDNRSVLYKDGSTRVVALHEQQFNVLDVNVLFNDTSHAIVEPCPKDPLAVASQTKLSMLPYYKEIDIVEQTHAAIK